MTVSEILTRAADRLEKPGRWTQEAFAKNADGLAVHPDDPRAVCWCAWGAIMRVSGLDTEPTHAAYRALGAIVGKPVGTWNDALERTAAEVVSALRKAADQARES